MKNLYNKENLEEIKKRINLLNSFSIAKWGKMATGEIHLPRLFIGRIVGPIFKSYYYNEK